MKKTNEKRVSLGVKIHRVVHLVSKVKTAKNKDEENVYSSLLEEHQKILYEINKDIFNARKIIDKEIEKMACQKLKSKKKGCA